MNATIMWPSGFHAETGTVRWTAAATTKRTSPLRTMVRSVMSASTQNRREAARPVKRRPAGDVQKPGPAPCTPSAPRLTGTRAGLRHVGKS